MEEHNFDTVTLLLDNGGSVECAILCLLPVDGRDYIALLPLDQDEDDDESPVYLYRYLPGPDGGEPELKNIEDDDEFEAVSDAYDEWLDTLEYEELDLDAMGLDPLE